MDEMFPVGDPVRQAIETAQAACEAAVAKNPHYLDDTSRGNGYERAAEAHQIFRTFPHWLVQKGSTELLAKAPAKLERVVKAWRWGKPGFLAIGPTGAGKTRGIAALGRTLLYRGVEDGGDAWSRARRIIWTTANDLCEARREWRLGAGEVPAIREACNASLLFLDDMGLDRDISAVRKVLEDRYDHAVPTVSTSGLSVEELDRHYSPAVMRRLFEPGGKGGVVVDLFGGGQ